MSDPNTLTPAAVLEERLSDKLLSRTLGDNHSEQMDAFFAASLIAIKCVLRAGEAGNVQCKDATREMMPFLNQLLRGQKPDGR